MKTPRFWYPSSDDAVVSWTAVLLSPLTHVFKAGTALRRMFAKPYRARVPVICVGNVVAGGAGKTPTALALARLLKARGQKPVFVTRGYGGKKTSGSAVVYVDPALHSSEDVGDEALLLATMAPTWAGRDRIAALRLAELQGTVIIMDDGMQNPHVKPTASVLVVDGEVGIGNGRLIPAGPLRELFEDALERVNALVVIGAQDRQKLMARARIPAFRGHLQPDLSFGFPRQDRFVAFAGIARPEKFYTTARELGLDVVETCDFPDHHAFDQADLDALRLRAEEHGALLLTTEKDAVRLPLDFRSEIEVLPVHLVFDDPVAEDVLARLFIPIA